MDLKHMFPTPPPVSAEWAPVYVEPLHGSGERFVVAVVCRDDASHGEAKLAVRSSVLKCMYGEQAGQVLGLAELTIESFHDHLLSGGDLGTWMLPSKNCHLGVIRVAYGDSLGAILNQGIRLTASLAEDVSVELPVQDDAGEVSALQVDRFVQQVKATVKQRVQDFESRFNRTVVVRQGAEPTSIGYLGVQIAANFDVLIPGYALTRKRTRAKAKLLDLQALKDQVDLAGSRHAYELMLWVPPQSSPLYSEADFRRSESVFLELQEIGDKHSLRVEKMSSPEQAAQRIFTAEGMGA
jgi:hypothetical protein